jgi:hypothetical protein
MARCPAGHESQASDYCDTCGLVIGGGETSSAGSAAPPASAVASPPPTAAPSPGGVAGAAVPAGGAASGAGCPVCQAERNGRFCEECGYDFDLAEAMPQVTMTPGVTPAPTSTVPAQSASASVSQQAAEASSGQQPGNGLDLDAELARAEAEVIRAEASAGAGVGAAAAASVVSETEAAAEVAATSGSTSAAATSAGADPFPTPAATPEAARESEPTASGVGALSALSGSSRPGAGTIGLNTEELSLVVNADADYYAAQVERGDILESEFPFPKYPHERAFSFADGPVRIGRASASRGISPEIDLTGPPLDPAVSHLHAQLLRHEEGWVVVDLGSANGTRLNDAEEPLEAETEIPVKQGDRIHLGVWTTITVQ